MEDSNITDEFESYGNSDFGLNAQAISFLSETRKWAKFLSVLGFIMLAILVLVSFSVGAIFDQMGQQSPMPSGALTAIYLFFSLIYFFPTYYLYQFSAKMKTALKHKDEQELAYSFKNIKSCFKFMGILTIIILGLYALIFIGGFLGMMVGSGL